MKAHTILWIAAGGLLCDAPPTAGMKIAAFAGDEIPNDIVRLYGLEIVGGRVTQRGKDPQTPKSTPDALIADRALYINNAGQLVESAPAYGIKIADEGDAIASFYVVQHKLEIKDGRVMQKKQTKAENKAVKDAPNKGARGSGGLSITTGGGTRSSAKEE